METWELILKLDDAKELLQTTKQHVDDQNTRIAELTRQNERYMQLQGHLKSLMATMVTTSHDSERFMETILEHPEYWEGKKDQSDFVIRYLQTLGISHKAAEEEYSQRFLKEQIQEDESNGAA